MARKTAISVTLDPKMIEFVQAKRQEEDSFSATLNRLLKSLAREESTVESPAKNEMVAA